MKPAPPFTPPDAGATYLGTYGVGNVWVSWLVSKAPEVAASTPLDLQRYQRRAPRKCPICSHPMVVRLQAPAKRDRRHRSKAKAAARRQAQGQVWKCYRHEPPAMVPIRIDYDAIPAPDVDVLAKVGRGAILDYVYMDDGQGARWVVLEDGKETGFDG